MLWVLLVVVVIAIVGVACANFLPSRIEENPDIPPFVPKPDNDKAVTVKGWNEKELRKAIDDFVDMYKDDGYPPFTINHNKLTENTFRLTFPSDIHPRLFVFLVNYAAYPIAIDGSNRSIVVVGRSTLSSEFEGLEPSLVGQTVLFYIPENDQDHDVVYLKTLSGDTYADSFSEMVWKRVSEGRLSKEARELAGDR